MRGMPDGRDEFRMPRANGARGRVRGALPRTPARGKPPETPGPFPFGSRFRNGPRRQGFAPPRKTPRALDCSGPFRGVPSEKGKGPNAKAKPSATGALHASRWSAFRPHYGSSDQLNIKERSTPRHVRSGSRLLETKLTFRLILRLEYAVLDEPGSVLLAVGHDGLELHRQ